MPAEMGGQPFLAFLSGAYAAGKSTLAGLIAESLGVPVVSRDDIYGGIRATEGFVDQEPGGELSRRGVAAFFSTIGNLVDSGVSLVAEHSLRRGVSEVDLAPLRSRARVSVVYVWAPPSVCIARFEDRAARERAARSWRADEYVIAQMRAGSVDWDRFEIPLDLNLPSLRVDTSDGYKPSLEQIVEWVVEPSGSV